MSNDLLKNYLLGEVVFEQKERAEGNPNKLSVYGVSNKAGITLETKYHSKKLHKYKILRKNMFAYNPMRLNIGSIGYSHNGIGEGLISPDYVVFGCVKEKLNPDYLYYFTKSDFWKRWVENAGVGSVRVRIYFQEIVKMPIVLPPLNVQKKIITILKTLDNKIELNNQINQTLEQIAQAIFKSWFVDFDPVKAKIAAKKRGVNREDIERAAMCVIGGISLANPTEAYAKLEQLPTKTQQQLKTTAALFPDELMESELGDIPKGWEIFKMGDHFNITMGQSPKGSSYNKDGTGILFFQGRKDFGFRYPYPRIYTTEPKKIADIGDTLLTVRAPVGDQNMAFQRCCIGRGLACIRHKKGYTSFTYAFIKNISKNLSHLGSDGTVFDSISQNQLKFINFVLPTKNDLVKLFEKSFFCIDQKIEFLCSEINTLSNLRDTLLPKLLSGEILPNQVDLDKELE